MHSFSLCFIERSNCIVPVFFLVKDEIKVDIFRPTEVFVDFGNDEYRENQMFLIDCKYRLGYPFIEMKPNKKRPFDISHRLN